ncbi:MAG TPA: transposase [Candidatus Nitrosocosmicus sp.]
MFGYNLHLTCTTDKIIVPLTADITTANVPDNKMYVPLASLSLVFSLPSILYTIADLGYDAKKLYKYSKKVLEIDLVCPVERYEYFQKEA